MGVTIKSKNHSIDLGGGGFCNLREKVAELTNEEIYNHYLILTSFPNYSQEEWTEYDKRINELDEKFDHKYNSILYFLYEPDNEAEIPVEVCKDLYELIKDYDDNILYGYCGRPDCAKFADFKRIVKDCIETDTPMEWW